MSSHVREEEEGCADEHYAGHVAYHGVMQPVCDMLHALPEAGDSADVLRSGSAWF